MARWRTNCRPDGRHIHARCLHRPSRGSVAAIDRIQLSQRQFSHDWKGTNMKINWFKRWSWVYLPVSFPGVLLVLAALAFSVQVFIAIDRHSHSVSDTLYGIFPYFA